MLQGKTITVVMPAYKAEATLERTVAELPIGIVDEVIIVDDASTDSTVEIARRLKVKVFKHASNLGYGGNQKTCYTEALKGNADIIIMVHPDYQYDPHLVTPMAGMISSGVYDVVLASRIIGSSAGWHAALQVHVQPNADRIPESAARDEALRIPQRIPGVLAKGAGVHPPLGEFGRLRI